MKKAMILAAAFAVVGLTSCKKDWTCTCTTTDSSGFFDDVTSSVTIADSSKKDAEAACDALNVAASTLSTSCELD